MALLDARGLIVSVNSAWREAFGAPKAGGRAIGVGTSYEDAVREIIPDLDADALAEAMRRLLAGEARVLTQAYAQDSAGGLRSRQIRIAPLKVGIAHFIAVHDDLAKAPRTQRRRTARQLQSIRKEERERIAIELHESTGRQLASLGLGLARLRRLIGGRAEAAGVLNDMANALEEAVNEIRLMSYLMEPPSLSRDGLEIATRQYVKRFGQRTGLNTLFRSEGYVDSASPTIQHAAYRMIQEALSNVHRHAKATGVEVELARRRGELTLRIADDGAGIGPLQQAHLEGIPPGVGIPGMRSRAEQLGGSLNIDSDAAGTVVTARIPLRHAPLHE